ncbi:MAG: hypothetical protein QOI77_3279 [Blastocatellia bacterium]|jgi:hypothetical protein|nr:hypothetical protein [Blastocatellia bacterium]
MNKSETNQTSRGWHSAALVLVITLVAVTAAVNDLDHLKQFTGDLGRWGASLATAGTIPVHAGGLSRVERIMLELPNQAEDQFRWTGRVAQGKSIEVKGINGSISAEPASGDQLEVTAIKTGRRSDPAQVSIKVVEHAGGVTICAVYPSDDPSEPNTCEPGQGHGRMNVRNNDVKVAFKVRVPAKVDLISRTVNGEINALGLAGNVESHTVNGSINISTSGYAQAKTVNGDISAKLSDANWPGALDFKTVNGGITVNLPSETNSSVEASTVSGDISSDFQLTILGTMSRKHLSGTIGGGGRELNLKTVNGSIHLTRG